MRSLGLALAGLVSLTLFSGCDAAGPERTATAEARAGNTQSYIVVLADEAPRGLERRLAAQNAAEHVYSHVARGFAAQLTARAARALARNPHVERVEPDQVVVLGRPEGKGPSKSDPTPTPTPEMPAETLPAGVARVGGGVGTDRPDRVACVLDTGIDLDHPDLTVSPDVARGGLSRSFLKGRDGKTADDGHGHGTHVAGIIGAKIGNGGTVGVAPGATLVSIRVLDSGGNGSMSGILAGVDYAATVGCTVANLSIGGGLSESLDEAIVAAASPRLLFAIAAGNSAADAMTSSPARAGSMSPYAFTISAVDGSDQFARFSNWGPAVRYAAPGVGVYSTYFGGGFRSMSGTSMAAPHAAGVLLLGSPQTRGTAAADPDGTADPLISH